MQQLGMNTAPKPSRKTADSISPLAALILVCVVAIVCYYTVRIAVGLGIPPEHKASFWILTPFLLAVLLLTPRRIWPYLIAAALAAPPIADFIKGVTLTSEIWLSLGDLVEVLIAAFGIHLLFRGTPHLGNVNALAKYVAVAVILAPGISGFVGAVGYVHGSYWLMWRIWFFADALGFLTVTPAILSWAHGGRRWAQDSRNYLESAVLLIWLVLFGYLMFAGTGWRSSPVLLYLLVPPLLWAGLRLGLKGVSTSMLIVTFMAVWGAAHDRGPFTGHGPLNNALSLQLFLFFAAIPFMVLAVLVEEEKQAQNERKRAMASLHESEQRFRLVANTAPVMIWMSGVDKLCNYFNDPWLEFTGRSFEQEQGNGWAEGVHPEDLQQCWDTYSNAFDQREPFQMEYRLRRHDGEYRWIMDQGLPRFNADGSLAGYIGSAIDVTERKLAEEALSTVSQKLIEAQEEERTRIARELHDDISQRLGLLAIRLDGLRHDLRAPADELRWGIGAACKQVEDLGSDVQTLSHRLHSSKLEYIGLVAASASFCKELAGRQNVEINFHSEDIPKKLPPDVALCLFRVLQEALQNAVRHSGVRHFEVSLTLAADELELSVEDRGVGFDPEKANRAHGLGLTSMRERLRLIDGQLSIDSKPRHGTTIRARAPVSPRVKSAGAVG
jgi:PAS domain S-box-containing protein